MLYSITRCRCHMIRMRSLNKVKSSVILSNISQSPRIYLELSKRQWQCETSSKWASMTLFRNERITQQPKRRQSCSDNRVRIWACLQLWNLKVVKLHTYTILITNVGNQVQELQHLLKSFSICVKVASATTQRQASINEVPLLLQLKTTETPIKRTPTTA